MLIDHPVHDDVKATLIESMRSLGAKVIEPIPGRKLRERRKSLLDDVIGIGRQRIRIGRDDEKGAWGDAVDQIYEIEPRRETRNDQRHLEAGAVGELATERAERSAADGEGDSRVECAREQCDVPTVGVPKDPDVGSSGDGAERGDGIDGVGQDLAHEQFAAHKTVHGVIVVLKPIVLRLARSQVGGVRRSGGAVFNRQRAARLKANSVRYQDSDPGARECGGERLQGVTDEASHFTLADVPLAIVLVNCKHRERSRSLRFKQERLNPLAIGTRRKTQRARTLRLGPDPEPRKPR